MCEYAGTKPKLQTAEKDIVTYKEVLKVFKPRNLLDRILRRKRILRYESVYYYSTFTPGELCETSLEEFIFRNLRWESRRGYYSIAKRALCTNVKCIIPKGAKYYKVWSESYDSYVYISDKIILKPL